MRSSILAAALCAACSGASAGVDAGVDAGAGCALAAATSPTGTVTSSCALLDRDTSGCAGQRADAGLAGFWLGFSCRVQLSVSGNAVRVQSDSRPDYPSPYFATGDACYQASASSMLNPNHIVAQALSMEVPLAPDTAGAAMPLGAVGMSVNGVALFSNVARPGDDIYQEVLTFDACGAHPAPNGMYHYHGEPYALSSADGRFIGVLRDGYPVYGRHEPDGGLPALDAAGGHVGPTPDSSSPAYHYHLNEQTSTNAATAGQKQWFLTTGTYRGTAGTCTGC